MDKKYLLKSSLKKARIARLIAKSVDLFLVLILGMLFYPFGLILAIFYLGLSDSLYGGQSVGKIFMGFAVISLEDGKPCSVKQSLIRNLPLTIPIAFAVIPPWGLIFCAILLPPLIILEIIFIMRLDSTHRLGDVMADTTVIANDPNRVDLRKNQQSWFKSEDKNMSPCNRNIL